MGEASLPLEIKMNDNEPVLNMTTRARVIRLMGDDPEGTDPAARDLIDALIYFYSDDAMRNYLRRAVKSKSRSENFDIPEGWKLYRDNTLTVKASPIDTSATVRVTVNSDNPRDFTDTDDDVDSDLIIIDPDRANRGDIYIGATISPGVNVVQVVYTGGMAANTAVEGDDGVAGAVAKTFTSASATFTTDGVQAGDTLNIGLPETSNANDGQYTVASVTNQTTLVTVKAFPSSTSGDDWSIVERGFVGIYPDIANAVTDQVNEAWNNKSSGTIESISASGENIKWVRPFGWTMKNKMILTSRARSFYG